MRRAISSMSLSVRRVVMSASLLVLDRVADRRAVDDGQDHRVDGAFVGDRGLPRGAPRGDEHHFVRTGADGVGRDDRVAELLPLLVQRADHQELDALDGVLLARGDDGAHDPCQLHDYLFLPCGAGVRPSGITASTWSWGRAMTCTATTSPTRPAAVCAASHAARTAATSPRTTMVV